MTHDLIKIDLSLFIYSYVPNYNQLRNMATSVNSKACCEKAFAEFDKEHHGYIDQKDLPAVLKKCCE